MNDKQLSIALCASLLLPLGCGAQRVDDEFGESGLSDGVEGDGDDDSDSDSETEGDTDGDMPCVDIGPRLLRRLTMDQVHTTLVVIFEDANIPEGQALTDPLVEGFRVDARAANIRDLGAQQVMQYAETIAEWAVPEKLDGLVPCQSNDHACHTEIVEELGPKFHREPLDAAMIELYVGLMAEEELFEDSMRQLLSTFIQSPYFLYRRELGDPDPNDPDRFELTDYELASNLSYSLTGGPPDATLLQLAADGQLRDEDQLLTEVTRLLSSPGGQDNLAHFVEGWLEIENVPGITKVNEPPLPFDDEVRQAMLAETDELFRHLLQSGGTVEDLFTADYSFLNAELAAFYGIEGVDSAQPTLTNLPIGEPGGRAPGILGHGSVLASHALVDNSSPIYRGVTVRRRLLCQELPEPPADVDTSLPPIIEGTTNRERYEEHTSNPDCAGCHSYIDPIGFTFEHYDEYGLWRAEEGGKPVDATGLLNGIEGDDIELDGLDELSAALSETAEVNGCFAHYMSYYTYGLPSCSPGNLVEQAGGEGATLMSTLEAIVRSPHFRERVLGE